MAIGAGSVLNFPSDRLFVPFLLVPTRNAKLRASFAFLTSENTGKVAPRMTGALPKQYGQREMQAACCT